MVNGINIDRDVVTLTPAPDRVDVVIRDCTPVVRKVVITKLVVKLSAPTLFSFNGALEKNCQL